MPQAAHAGCLGFARPGDRIAIVGPFSPSRTGSEVAKLQGEAPVGALPIKDMPAVLDAHDHVRSLVRSQALQNAHDIAEGGLAVALAECCIAGGIGARVRLPEGLDPFGEDLGSAFVVSGDAAALEGLTVIGEVGGEELVIEQLLSVEVKSLQTAYFGGLDDLLR
jgi:phosphoribosylformylglycinamidine synthase